MSLLAGGGGYKVAELVCFFGISGLEGGLGKYYQTGSKAEGVKRGLCEGGKAVVTKLNVTVDYAWTAAAPTTKYGAAKAMGVLTEQAAAYLGQAGAGQPSRPCGKEAIAAMKHRQQMEWDDALVKDFVATDRQYRRALVTRAPAPHVERLRLSTGGTTSASCVKSTRN